MSRTRWVVTSVGVMLLIGGCSSSETSTLPDGSSETSTSSAESASPVPPPAPLDWQDCGALECATLTVPLDYDDPAAGTVDLAVARNPSDDDDRIGSLVLNPGGPGGSGVGFLRSGGPGDLHPAFDLVSWDPRGVGDSRGLDCGPTEDFFGFDPTPDDVDERATLEGSARSIADRCASADAELLPTMTTETTALDLEQLRRALDDEPLNYLGFSYGTHIGLQYAAMFPDQIRAMVLDGVVDPRESLTELLTGQAIAIERVLADRLTRYREVAEAVEVEPLPTRGDERVGPGLLGVAAFASIYSPGGVNQFDRALERALEGDGEGLDELSEDYVGSSSFAAYLGVLCADSPRPADTEAWQGFITEIARAAPDLGASVGNELLPCAFWPFDPLDEETELISWAGDLPPILLVAATDDAATPLDDAERIHADLPNSALLVREGGGHTSLGLSSCVADAVWTYLVDLQPPDEGTVCES